MNRNPHRPKVKWLHAPGHVSSIGPDVVRRAHISQALVIDWTEMYHNIDDLKKNCPGYNHFIGAPGRKDKRGREVNHDVVISTRHDADVLYDESFFVDSEIKSVLKYHPERHGKARVIGWNGLVILIVAFHPQPNALKMVNLVLPHYKKSLDRVIKVQQRLVHVHKPDLVLMGGDLQMGRGHKLYNPNVVAHDLGLDWANHKIDWQMWSKDWDTVEEHTIDVSPLNKGMDHFWMERQLRQPH